jgi:hypothetical protein
VRTVLEPWAERFGGEGFKLDIFIIIVIVNCEKKVVVAVEEAVRKGNE